MLADYWASSQAREDVGAILGVRGVRRRSWGTITEIGSDGIAWMQIKAKVSPGQVHTAYYRPDGDRYVVTDLGEGVRALRLRTGCSQYLAMKRSDPMREALRTSGIGNVWSTERGIMKLDNITAADLPDAICRVMLASMRVAQS